MLQKFTNLFLIFSISGPLIIGSLSNFFLNLVDIMILGHYGKSEMAAAGAAIAVISLLIETLASMTIGYQTYVAREIANKNTENSSSFFISSFLSNILIGAFALILFGFFSNKILNIFSISENTHFLAQQFLMNRIPGLMLVIAAFSIKSTLDVSKLTKYSLYVSLSANCMNIFASYILVFGKLGIESQGILGAAWGTNITNLFSFLLYIFFLFKHRKIIGIHFAYPSFQKFILMLRIGYVEAMNLFILYAGGLFFSVILSSFGDNILAAYRSSQTTTAILWGMAMNLGYGIQIILTREKRFDQKETISNFLFPVRKQLLLISFIVFFLFVLLSNPLSRVMTKFTDIQKELQTFIIICSAAFPFMVMTTINISILRSRKLNKWIMITSILSIWIVQIPFAYISKLFFLSPLITLLAYPICMLVRWVLTNFYLRIKLYASI